MQVRKCIVSMSKCTKNCRAAGLGADPLGELRVLPTPQLDFGAGEEGGDSAAAVISEGQHL